MPKANIKRNLTERLLRTLKPQEGRTYLVWDQDTRGLALAISPNGLRWKFIYSFHGRARWYSIGDANALGISDARIAARLLRVKVDAGIDPQAERKAQRSAG